MEPATAVSTPGLSWTILPAVDVELLAQVLFFELCSLGGQERGRGEIPPKLDVRKTSDEENPAGIETQMLAV